MVHTTAQHALYLEPGLRDIVIDAFATRRLLVDRLFKRGTTKKRVERVLNVGQSGPTPEFLGLVQENDFADDFLQTSQVKLFAEKMVTQIDLIWEDQYDVINRKAKSIVENARQRYEFDGMDVFNDAFAGIRFLGGNGLPLCSTAQTFAAAGSPTNNNRLSLALNHSNLITAVQTMRRWKNDKGQPLNRVPKILLVPIELSNAAVEATGGTERPDTTNRAINTLAGGFAAGEAFIQQSGGWIICCSEYLIDPTAWFIIDPSKMDEFVYYLDLKKPQFMADQVQDTLSMRHTMVFAFNLFWSHYSWILGSKP